MFYIDQTTDSFKKAKEEHYKNVRYVIKKKLLGKDFNEVHPSSLTKRINKIKGSIPVDLKDFLIEDNNLKNLLIGTPDVLDSIKNDFRSGTMVKFVKKLITHDSFISRNESNTFSFYNAFDLAKNLNIQTCIYCNRLYTHTMITDKKELVARATFDHWFPKSKYPLLALSFYNLIPSCNICNSSVKGSKPMALDGIFHPYLKHAGEDKQMNFRFSYTLEDHLRAESKIVPNNEFSGDSIDAMKLKEMYSFHHEEIRELIYLKKAYSDSYLSSLHSILGQDQVLTKEEVYRLAFGAYMEDDHLHRRPLSKLKKDILIELGILK